ncbi:hypothetical protein [Halosegnis marinus]|uniref:hypothetical protein n=1 Tax=Halosegnis marinus TaxID=3034023 RepID=UPI0036188140
MDTAGTSGRFFGRDEDDARRWAAAALALSLGSFVLFSAVKALDYPTVHLLLWWEGYAVLLTALVGVQSYSNGGS